MKKFFGIACGVLLVIGLTSQTHLGKSSSQVLESENNLRKSQVETVIQDSPNIMDLDAES